MRFEGELSEEERASCALFFPLEDDEGSSIVTCAWEDGVGNSGRGGFSLKFTMQISG